MANTTIEVIEGATYQFDIYIAGDYALACNLLQKYVERGECVSITPCDYIYKYGRESGVKVTLINYPRFPRAAYVLEKIAKEIGEILMDGLSQGSFTVVCPNRSFYYNRRDT
jgi:hypothetical protein